MGVNTEQLPASTYLISQIHALTGYEIIDAKMGFQEDTEDKVDTNGRFKAKITYSRRQTLQLELEALAAATPATYVAGGQIASGTLKLADGSTASAWNILSADYGRTKGVATLSLSLIQAGDLIPVTT